MLPRSDGAAEPRDVAYVYEQSRGGKLTDDLLSERIFVAHVHRDPFACDFERMRLSAPGVKSWSGIESTPTIQASTGRSGMNSPNGTRCHLRYDCMGAVPRETTELK